MSKKKCNLKGGVEYTFDELKKKNQGNILINFNLTDENDEEILNLIDKNEIYSIQDEIITKFHSYLKHI